MSIKETSRESVGPDTDYECRWQKDEAIKSNEPNGQHKR